MTEKEIKVQAATKEISQELHPKNKNGEFKKLEHEGLFLLCWKVGLRISEAINFDLSLEHQQAEYKNLYLLRGKRKGEFILLPG